MRLQRYYGHLENLLWPDLIVVGGGVSKKADKFLPLLAPPHPDRGGPAAEQRRHHRRGLPGRDEWTGRRGRLADAGQVLQQVRRAALVDPVRPGAPRPAT